MLFQQENENDELLPFTNRAEAGRILAGKLTAYSGHTDVVVLGLARGGLVVAFQVAQALRLPLDVFIVRKLGVPWNAELAMGAIATGGAQVLDRSLIQNLRLTDAEVQQVVSSEQRELQRREQLYHGGYPAIPLAGKTVILVDDGIATGNSVLAAIAALRRQHVANIVVAAPVIATSSYYTIRSEVDELICIAEPESFSAISQWYEDFSQVSDSEVCALLEQARKSMLHVA